jgi:hypothetical protein
MGASISHNPMSLHGLLQGYLYLFYLFSIAAAVYKRRIKIKGRRCRRKIRRNKKKDEEASEQREKREYKDVQKFMKQAEKKTRKQVPVGI